MELTPKSCQGSVGGRPSSTMRARARTPAAGNRRLRALPLLQPRPPLTARFAFEVIPVVGEQDEGKLAEIVSHGPEADRGGLWSEMRCNSPMQPAGKALRAAPAGVAHALVCPDVPPVPVLAY